MDFQLPNGTRVHLIGDPHLGRKFEVGVPLHKRGRREASQFQDFRDRLDTEAGVTIMVGDLFDHPFVSYAVVDETASAIRSAVERHEDTIFVMMAGNHDLPRNTTSVGAFHDLVDRLDGRYTNLVLARRPMVVNDIAIFPWEWDRSADEQVKDLENEKVVAAVGHWDLATFDGKDDHLAPVDRLFSAFGTIPLYSGHFHVAGDYPIQSGVVACTGSLQPYAHDQDPTSSLYITTSLSDALTQPEGYFKDKMVRVILGPGENLPDILEAMAVTPLRKSGTDTKVNVSLREFDWQTIFADHIKDLDPEVQIFIKEKLPNAEFSK